MLLKRFSWIESKICSTHSLCLPIRNICKQGEPYEHFDPRGTRSMHHLKVSYSSYTDQIICGCFMSNDVTAMRILTRVKHRPLGDTLQGPLVDHVVLRTRNDELAHVHTQVVLGTVIRVLYPYWGLNRSWTQLSEFRRNHKHCP